MRQTPHFGAAAIAAMSCEVLVWGSSHVSQYGWVAGRVAVVTFTWRTCWMLRYNTWMAKKVASRFTGSMIEWIVLERVSNVLSCCGHYSLVSMHQSNHIWRLDWVGKSDIQPTWPSVSMEDKVSHTELQLSPQHCFLFLDEAWCSPLDVRRVLNWCCGLLWNL